MDRQRLKELHEQLPKPHALSRRAWNKYLNAFENGSQFWTSEDGTLMSLVILPVDNWAELLTKHHSNIFEKEPFDATRIRFRYAYQKWAGHEYFDGRNSDQRGKIWSVDKHPTSFPVLEYELKIPR